jgi:hypothetical protein
MKGFGGGRKTRRERICRKGAEKGFKVSMQHNLPRVPGSKRLGCIFAACKLHQIKSEGEGMGVWLDTSIRQMFK